MVLPAGQKKDILPCLLTSCRHADVDPTFLTENRFDIVITYFTGYLTML